MLRGVKASSLIYSVIKSKVYLLIIANDVGLFTWITLIPERISSKVNPLNRQDDAQDDQDPSTDFWEVLYK